MYNFVGHTQILNPRGQEFLRHLKKVTNQNVSFFIAHKKGIKFHAQPQTGAYSC